MSKSQVVAQPSSDYDDGGQTWCVANVILGEERLKKGAG